MISSTALAIGATPLSAAPARLPDKPGIYSEIANMMVRQANRIDLQRGGMITEAGACDHNHPNPPNSKPPTKTAPAKSHPAPSNNNNNGKNTSPPLNNPGSSINYTLSNADYSPGIADDNSLITVDCHDNDRSVPFDRDTAEGIAAEVEMINVECAQLDPRFQIDCLAAKYERIALLLPNTGDQRIIKSSLNKAARKLRRIVRQNADASVPRTRFALETPDGATKPITTRPIKAIESQSLETANAEAVAVIDELSTKLLRSSENSERRQEYFAGIAQAVDSNKLLLRS
ncbi:MAG: hypothetical protein ABJH85_00370 [Paracoccaceae bacterium]